MKQQINILHEDIFISKAVATGRAISRSTETRKLVYLIQTSEGWMVNSHGVLRQGQKIISTYKLGEKIL